MLKFAVLFILVVHGLIHLMGFIKEWKLGEIKELSGKTVIHLSDTVARTAGILWLITSLVLVGSAVGLLLNKDWWWVGAAGGVILSQSLITLYWKDAWAGSVANLFIVAMIFWFRQQLIAG